MPDVFSFIDPLLPRPERPDRLFFALKLDSEVAAEVADFRARLIRECGLKGSLIAVDRLHLSLHMVGDFKRLRDRHVWAAAQAADRVALRPFAFDLAAVQSFRGRPVSRGRAPRRPLVLSGACDELTVLHGDLGAEMRRMGMKASLAFTPHVTLLYGPDLVPCRPIAPIRTFVRSFVLIHSELWLSRYHILGEWPLH